MNEINVEKVENLKIHNGGPEPRKGRSLDHTTLAAIRRKFPDAKISGHPDNFFKPIFRISSEQGGFFRSFDALPLVGGGVILQSSWFERGRPALAMTYEPDLILREAEYTDEDGERRLGYRVAGKGQDLAELKSNVTSELADEAVGLIAKMTKLWDGVRAGNMEGVVSLLRRIIAVNQGVK